MNAFLVSPALLARVSRYWCSSVPHRFWAAELLRSRPSVASLINEPLALFPLDARESRFCMANSFHRSCACVLVSPRPSVASLIKQFLVLAALSLRVVRFWPPNFFHRASASAPVSFKPFSAKSTNSALAPVADLPEETMAESCLVRAVHRAL